MLRNSRKDYPNRTTPKGTAVWPSLNEPDYKFKEGGEYHVKLRFDPDAPGLQDLIEYAEELRDAAYDAEVEDLNRKGKKALIKKLEKLPVITEEEDQDTGEPTGKLLLRAKLNHRVEVKKGPRAGKVYTFTPDFFDARGRRLKNPPQIGGGSELKLSVRPMDFETKDTKTKGTLFGTSYELQAVQIITLRSGGSRSADDYGFGEEEGDEIADTSDFGDEGEGYEGDDDDSDTDF